MTRTEKLDELIKLEFDLRDLRDAISTLRTELGFAKLGAETLVKPSKPKPKRLSSAGQALIDASANGNANPELDKRGHRKPKWTAAKRKEYADRMRLNQAKIQAGKHKAEA